MDLHNLALRASKNDVLARYFGRKGSLADWEKILTTWPQEQVQTFELILGEVEGMELDVEKKAARRHEIADTRMKQRFEAVKADLTQQYDR